MHHHLHRFTLFRRFSTSPSPPFTALSNLLQGRIPHSHLLQIHARIFLLNAHQDNLIATRLIGHYPSKQALKVFKFLKQPNLFPFNAIIRVLSEEGLYINAFQVLNRANISPFLYNDLTFSFLLKACFKADNDSNYVKQIHTHIVKLGFVDNVYVCNGLLNVYAKGLKDFIAARKVFDEMPDKGVVRCWTNLISGYAVSGQSEEALKLFLLMVKENIKPENDTMVSVLSACSTLEMLKIEKWVNILTNVESESSEGDSLKTVLVYLYGKCEKIDKSREKSAKISENGKKNVLSWNAIIGAYVQNNLASEALCVFKLMMKNHNCIPNHVTMVSVLSACAQIGDLDLGTFVHNYINTKGRKGILASNTNLATALIDMYSKCGSLENAKQVFHRIIKKDVVSFNAIIMGLAINGKGHEAFKFFSTLLELNLRPDSGTFLGLLSACSHTGMLEKGRYVFYSMSKEFCVKPKLEHYACYIDLLARLGCINEAVRVVSKMPFEGNKYVYGALLNGCTLHNRMDLAKGISVMLNKVDPKNSGGYVMMSNVLASEKRWGDVSGLRCFMREKGVIKNPGCSWISVDGFSVEFRVGFVSHPWLDIIYSTLDRLCKEMKVPS